MNDQVIDNYIFAKYKNEKLYSYKGFIQLVNKNDPKLVSKANMYQVYVKILKYQIKNYGCTLAGYKASGYFIYKDDYLKYYN